MHQAASHGARRARYRGTLSFREPASPSTWRAANWKLWNKPATPRLNQPPRRPFSNRERAFCLWFVNRFVHGGLLAPRLRAAYDHPPGMVRDAGGGRTEDRPVLDELVAYFGDGNRSAYLRATLKVMKSIMIADQLREAQAYGQQRTAELGIDPSDIPARVQDFLKADS